MQSLDIIYRSNSFIDVENINQKHMANSNTTPHLHTSSLIKDISMPNLSVHMHTEGNVDCRKDDGIKKWNKAELANCHSIYNLLLKLPNQIFKQTTNIEKHKMYVEDVSLTLISSIEALTNVLNNILFKD